MDILLRNVDVVAVKKIDELAKKKKMSRNEFLKIQLEKLAWLDVLQEEQNRFDDAIQMFSELLVRMMNMIQKQSEKIERLHIMFSLIANIDESEVEDFIDDFLLREEVYNEED